MVVFGVLIDTDGVTTGFTVMVIAFEVVRAGVTQFRVLLISQLTTSPLDSDDDV